MDESQWQYQPAGDLDKSLAKRLASFPREPDMLVYGLRTAAALTLRSILRTYHRLQIIGREHLPAEGSFVMVANHASHLDALCLLSALPLGRLHRAFPLAAQDYFFVNIRRTAIAAIFINAAPFSRHQHVRQSLDLCRGLLANPGNILILFPEGTRTTTGQMGEFRPGIGSLLAGETIPVIPCGLTGAYNAWPKGKWLPSPRSVRLTIGPARNYADLPRGRESVRHIANDLENAVKLLVG